MRSVGIGIRVPGGFLLPTIVNLSQSESYSSTIYTTGISTVVRSATLSTIVTEILPQYKGYTAHWWEWKGQEDMFSLTKGKLAGKTGYLS